MDISVVILNWNGLNLLKTYLESVVKYSKIDGLEVEVVIADNGSTDESLLFVKNKFPFLRIIALDKNYGFAQGYNEALKNIVSKYVVLLNSDVQVVENWLLPLYKAMEEDDKHSFNKNSGRLVAVQPKILSYNNKKFFEHAGAAGGFIDFLGYPFCRGRVMNSLEEDKGQYDSPVDIFWASGACLFIRTKDYKRVGGLDPLFFAHMEEIDLCWRLNSRGYRIACIPSSRVYHLGGATLEKSNPQKTFLNYRNNLLMIYKNVFGFNYHLIMFIRFFMDYLSLCIFLLKGMKGDAKAVFKARKAFLRLKKIEKKNRFYNKKNRTCKNIKTLYKGSVVLNYYILKKRMNGYKRIFNA